MGLDLSPVSLSTSRRLTLALRMAWRDIKRHRARSVLIIGLIALPVFALSLLLVVISSATPTPEETVTQQLGSTQGRVDAGFTEFTSVRQTPQGDLEFVSTGPLRGEQIGFEQVLPLLSTDYELLPWWEVELTAHYAQAELPFSAVASQVLHPGFRR
ncbi:hypothetical protein [Glutamicibacter uratoxydans]|uniref:hypothetical protein n=1 Tax=Glutamicibacter uratoxydans TaxID=43667 RepID=UPI003D6E88C0